MLRISEIDGADARAARRLCDLTAKQLSRRAGIGIGTLERFELGFVVRERSKTSVIETLYQAGARIVDHGDVRHVDGRVAPSKLATGHITGARLAKARRKLGMQPEYLAGLAGVSVAVVKALERRANPDHTAGFYRVVGVLQLAGYSFGPWRHRGYSGDRLLVPPVKPPPRDKSSYHLKGWRPKGLPRGLEEPGTQESRGR